MNIFMIIGFIVILIIFFYEFQKISSSYKKSKKEESVFQAEVIGKDERESTEKSLNINSEQKVSNPVQVVKKSRSDWENEAIRENTKPF